MSDAHNMQSALRSIVRVRSNAGRTMKCAANGMMAKHGDEGKEKKFLSELKLQIDSVNGQMKEVEHAVSIQQPVSSMPLGHSIYLSYDTMSDMVPVYNSLVASYKWLDKAHDFSGGAAALLSQNNLSRTYVKAVKNRKKSKDKDRDIRTRVPPPEELDNLIASISRIYSDMMFKITRPNDTKLNAILEVTLERILTAVLVCKGIIIEAVVVRGYGEHTGKRQPDVWTESTYQVFQRISENANAAMLHFQSPLYPELAVKSFMTYLHSFVTLFTDKCRKCGYHLHSNVPPTWREFKTLEPYHEDCKPA